MNIEALWAVQFTGANAARIAKSGGVIVTETDRIFGGDTWMWYTGTYHREDAGRFAVRIQTGVHNQTGGESIFGGPLRPMVLVGEFQLAKDMQTATANLTVEGQAGMRLTATLTRRAELP
jgi:hypothetical protein